MIGQDRELGSLANTDETDLSARWRLSLCAIIAAAGLWAAQGAPAEARDAKKPAAEPAEANADPLKLVISLKKQRVQVYRGADLVATSRVSTGKRGYGTPSGIYSILEKRRWHRSNIYSGAPMPFMQRITWSGIALHAGRVPNYPASHGCIRLPAKFAESLFSITAKGAHVVVVRDEAAPKPFDHVALFQPSVPPKLDYASAGTPVSEPFSSGCSCRGSTPSGPSTSYERPAVSDSGGSTPVRSADTSSSPASNIATRTMF